MKTSIFKKIRVYIPFVIVIVLIFIYFNSKNKVTSLVKKVSVQNRLVTKTVSANGSIKSRNQANISFAVGGQIKYIYVKEGQVVKSGQILASVDNNYQLQTAQSYKDARDIVLRERDLFINKKDTNKTTLGGWESYYIKLREYDEQLSQAEANYKAQLATLTKTNIYAPFDGTVVIINKRVGETAIAGETVATVADLNKLVFEILVDQEDFGRIKIGQDTDIKLDSFDGTVFKGKVLELPAQANASDSNFTVKIDLVKAEGTNFTVGMTGDAYMTIAQTSGEVPSLLYNEILKDDSGKTYIWIVDNGKLKKLSVEIGLEGDLYTELKTKVDKQIVLPATEGEKIQEGYTAKFIN